MILYQTWIHFWWLRHGGSAIVKLNTIVPALVCAAITALLQYTDEDFCARLTNRNTASLTAEELAALDAAGGCDEVDYVVKWQHPYVHQAFTLCVTFLLTYRSQLAYQRFWEARTHMTVMSNRWTDAAMSLYIFDDQHDKDKNAEDTQDNFRGQLLHLMSLLHCFACLHLMRREEVEADERDSDGIQKHDQDEAEDEAEDEEESHHGSSRSHSRQHGSFAEMFKCNRTPAHRSDAFRPAHRQLNNLQQATWFRIRHLCRKNPNDRFDLGVMGDLQDGEKRALYPPWDVTSKHIEHVLYRNHELPGCCYHRRDQRIHAHTSNNSLRDEKRRKIVEANMFDRVSLIMGWIFRLIGHRRDAGGLWVPPPVLSRPYQNLNDGHLAFGMCKKIRDTPFPFPYAQLMSFLLVLFCLSFPFVAAWAVPAQDNWPWKARILSFLVCLSLFALNEVARELEVPFHVAHNDINIEELHDEFLSMLESLHTNFSKPAELGFHNDLRDKVITPEHILNRACNCVKCDSAEREKQEESAQKARMVWNTTDTATASENRNLKDLLNKQDFDFNGQDFHTLQAFQLSKLQRARKDAGAVSSEELCLQLAAQVRGRIPPKWAEQRKLQFIKDIDLWLLLEAKHNMTGRWRVGSIKQADGDTPSLTRRASMKRRGGSPVRCVRTVSADQGWALTNVAGWNQHLDDALKDSRQDSLSKIGSHLIAKEEERDEECELMYLWKELLNVKRGGGDLCPEPVELTPEEQDFLDHASVFMSSHLTRNKHDEQSCKTNIQLYREEVKTIRPDRDYNETVIRIMKRIADRRPLTTYEKKNLDSLTLSVLESKERDYREVQRLSETDLSILDQQQKDDWHLRLELKRFHDAKLNEKEQADLNRLRREKYDKAFTGVGLKDLKDLERRQKTANNEGAKDEISDEEKRKYEHECEQRGEPVQEAYLSLLALLPREQLTEEQVKTQKMLRLISFYRRRDVRHKNHFNPMDALRALPEILQRKDPAELTESEREWKDYQDLQFEELHQRSTSGTGEILTEEEEQELGKLRISILQRKKRDCMVLEEVEELHATLKAQLSEDTRDEELLEWLNMRRNELALSKLKEKAHAAGTDKELPQDMQFLEQQIRFEQACIKVLERKQYEPDFSEKKQLEELIAKEKARAQAKKQRNMKKIVNDGFRLIEATEGVAALPLSATDAKLFDQIEATIEKLQVEDLIGMRTETEEDLLDKLYVRQLERKLRQNAALASTPVVDESEDEESQKARLDELAREKERITYDLERRQQSILEREKALAWRALKDAVKKAEDLKTSANPVDLSTKDASSGQIDAAGSDDDAQQEELIPYDGMDVSQTECDAESAKAKNDVELKRKEVDRIDAKLDQLLLKDLERRHKKGLLDSEEEAKLDVQIKRCLTRERERKAREGTGELDAEQMQRLMDAELRLLERKAKNQMLDDNERYELDLRTFYALSTKKKSVFGLTVDDVQRLEKVIVDIYTARKREALKKGAADGKKQVVLDEQLWSSDEDLDLKRYELKMLQQHKDAGSLSDRELERVYNLRCEMIDGLTERIAKRAEIEQIQRGSDRTVPKPEPQPEPEPEPQLATPRAGGSVSFSLKVDVDDSPTVGAERQPSNEDTTTNDSGTTLSTPDADSIDDTGGTTGTIGADQQLPGLGPRLALTPRAEAKDEGGTLDDEDLNEDGQEAVQYSLNVGQRLPSGLVMLPSSPFGDEDLASPSPFAPATPFAQHSTDLGAETSAGLSLDRDFGEVNHMSVVESMMLSPRLQESIIVEDGMVGQRLLSRRLTPDEEEDELRELQNRLKKELKDLLSADAKAQLTAEQQVRLKSLADSAEEGQEIDRLIAGSIEANRPKTVRGAENVGKILVGSNSPRTTSTASAEIEDAVKQSSSLKRSLSLKTAGVSSTVVANQLAEQARVAQSVNLQNTLRRTNSDFITPRWFTHHPSNLLDERGQTSRCQNDEQENLMPVGDPDTSGGGTDTSGLRKMLSAPTNVCIRDPDAQEHHDQSQDGVEEEQNQEAQLVSKFVPSQARP